MTSKYKEGRFAEKMQLIQKLLHDWRQANVVGISER